MATQVKKELVAELVEKIKKAQSVVFVDYQGIKVNEETSLRKQMRENGAEYLVAKNRLFKIALKESGVEDNFDEILEGTTAFAFGYNDPVAPAKAVFDLAKAKIKEGDQEFVKGHEAHAGLIQKEANGETVVPNILLMHAEDQLMAAETIKMMALEIIKLNQRLYSLEK